MANYKMTGLSLDAMLGFNTKQLWVYDNTNDVFIDPPKEVLDKLDEKYGAEWSQEKQDDLLAQAEALPDWLFETDYWYDGEETEI